VNGSSVNTKPWVCRGFFLVRPVVPFFPGSFSVFFFFQLPVSLTMQARARVGIIEGTALYSGKRIFRHSLWTVPPRGYFLGRTNVDKTRKKPQFSVNTFLFRDFVRASAMRSHSAALKFPRRWSFPFAVPFGRANGMRASSSCRPLVLL